MQSALSSLGLLLARVPLGAYFAIAGYNKLRNYGPSGFATTENVANAAQHMPENLARPFMLALPWVELSVGLLVIIGLGTRFAGLVMSLLLASFLIAATPLKLNIYGLTGDGMGPAFQANAVLLGTAAMLVFTGSGLFGVDGLFVQRRRARFLRADGRVEDVVIR